MFVHISPERPTAEYLRACNQLFEAGLHNLHLRLPEANRETYIWAIMHIEPKYRRRIILCDYFDLVERAGLGGVHLSEARRAEWQEHIGRYRMSISAHSIEDLESLPFAPTYALLSPVYDSISKEAYSANERLRQGAERLRTLPFPVLALGGITPRRSRDLYLYGFSGYAVLGYLSEAWRGNVGDRSSLALGLDTKASREDFDSASGRLTRAFKDFDQVTALSVGGHDPSSGAGITADVRMMDTIGVHALSVCSCLTAQHEGKFDRLIPLPIEEIIACLSLLLERHRPTAMKIGMTASLSDALAIARLAREAGIKHIVWDPILGASAGQEALHKDYPTAILDELLGLCTLVTPNIKESDWLWGTSDAIALRGIAHNSGCAILLKGGHRPYQDEAEAIDKSLVQDVLLLPSGQTYTYASPRYTHDKHGTGCHLSSAIVAHLSLGYDLNTACLMSRDYLQIWLRSSTALLGTPSSPHKQSPRYTISQYPIQYITNGRNEKEITSRVATALQGGIRWVQLRMKEASSAERLSVALSLKALMTDYPDAILIIDDDVAVALASNADGVHLGLKDMPIAEARRILGESKVIGGTCNTAEDLKLRALEGADYVGCGPWAMTQTKQNLSPILGKAGMLALSTYNRGLPLPLPLYAIGGITQGDMPHLIKDIKVTGIALSGLIEQADDTAERCRQLITIAKGINPE